MRARVRQVAAGRGQTVEAVRQVAKGRVWTGEDALAHGLVDALGGLQDAVRLAKQEAGLPLEARPTCMVSMLVLTGCGTYGQQHASLKMGVTGISPCKALVLCPVMRLATLPYPCRLCRHRCRK